MELQLLHRHEPLSLHIIILTSFFLVTEVDNSFRFSYSRVHLIQTLLTRYSGKTKHFLEVPAEFI